MLTSVIACARYPEPAKVARQVSSTSSRTGGRMIRGAAVATRGGIQESYRRSHGDGRSQSCPAGNRTGGSGIGSHARSGGRSRRCREIAPDGCAPLEPRRLGGTVRSTRSHRAAGGAGDGTGAGARADPLRTDVGLAVCLLPRCGVRHGLGPGRFAADRPARAALRRCASGQFRRLRLAGAAVAVRPQRLRRDASRPVGMGREAFGGQRCRRRPREWLRG